ncbi:hypothetical protein V6N11_081550 [Hibiscus sabdariffa]|uniref:Uncharacterized protein n=2 Tax=Hibiscus sabdariffa TaxID=183260 RepID=A0ABR2AAM5_9ROSI
MSSLWVQLLRQKYKLTTLLPESIHRASCTLLGRALSKYWEVLLNGIVWSLGSVKSIRPLNDTWIPTMGPLCDHLKHEALLFLVASFLDLLDGNGS